MGTPQLSRSQDPLFPSQRVEDGIVLMVMTTSPEFKLQNTLQGHIKPVNQIAVSPGCSRLISIGASLL
jgi:hypothetical protein